MKKILIILPLAILILLLAVFVVNKKAKDLSQPVNFIEASKPVVMENPELHKEIDKPKEKPTITQEAPENEIIPEKYQNQVAFTSQAPYAKWDDLHDEACEEASIIMAHAYLTDKEELEISEAEDEIQKMVAFQKNYFGSHKDLNAEEMIELAKEFYDQEYKLIKLESKEEPITTEEDQPENQDLFEEAPKTDPQKTFQKNIDYLIKELSRDNIFIIPMAGRKLQNPYFRSPGPLYHALVLTGYDQNKKEFITNDPGTRRGENYHYSYEIFYEAIHDFPGQKTKILEGAKNVILVEKNSL